MTNNAFHDVFNQSQFIHTFAVPNVVNFERPRTINRSVELNCHVSFESKRV